MDDTIVTTARLLMRRALPDDLDDLHGIMSNPVAMRYWSTLPHTHIVDTRVWLKTMMESPEDESDDFVVEFEGRVIGKAGFYRLPEIGYIFHPDYWGQGFAQECLSALIQRAFTRFGVEALIADVDPRNIASLRLLAKLGFVETDRKSATWLIGDQWCDSVYLRITPDRLPPLA